ncbi:hypothetical protein Tco_1071239 [Tanacetum coccineum]
MTRKLRGITSPVEVLKKRHSQKNKKDDHKVVLEDLEGGGIYGDIGVEFCGGEEEEKELVKMGEVGEGPFGEGEGGIAVAGVDRDKDAEKEDT